MSAHTPGPWVVHDERASTYITTMSGGRVGFVNSRFGSGEQTANARLIAAAPTMYEYIASSASNGCAEAKKILEVIHACS